MANTKEETPIPFDITARKTVYSSDLDKHHITGTPMEVGLLVAEKLLKNMMATEKPPTKKA